jgi:hypothetical protein
MDTLLGDDVGAAFAPPDPPNIGAFSPVPDREDRPMARVLLSRVWAGWRVVGLVGNLLLAAWWIDAVTSLGSIWFVVKEAREAWSGEDRCDTGNRTRVDFCKIGRPRVRKGGATGSGSGSSPLPPLKCDDWLMNLEAPPGFEPGVEVLQTGPGRLSY